MSDASNDTDYLPSDLELGFVPNSMVSDDPADQDLASHFISPEPQQRNHGEHIYPLRLSDLRRVYENDASLQAMTDLCRLSSLRVDPDLVVPPQEYTSLNDSHGPQLTVSGYFLDFSFYVSRFIGFGAIRPSENIDITWSFELTVAKLRTQQFYHKRGVLGFDAKECMAFVGTMNQEQVFLAFAPREFVLGAPPTLAPGLCTGSPRLRTRRWYLFCLCLAKVLQHIGIPGIYCTDKYGPHESVENLERSTNIMCAAIASLDR